MSDIAEHNTEQEREKYYCEDSGVNFSVARLSVSRHN